MLQRLACLAFIAVLAVPVLAQQRVDRVLVNRPLTVAQIMQDPATWIGDWPTGLHVRLDGRTYFYWNPQGEAESDSLYVVEGEGSAAAPRKLTPEERRALPPRFGGWQHGGHAFDRAYQRHVYAEDGDLYLYDRTRGTRTRLTQTDARESDPRFTPGGQAVIFAEGRNLFRLDLNAASLTQLTDLRSGSERKHKAKDEQDAYLDAQQQTLFETLRTRRNQREARDAARERERIATDPPPTFYVGDQRVGQLQLDPTERFVTFDLSTSGPSKGTDVQDFVTESGYAENLSARPKVGVPGGTRAFYVQDLARDTTFAIDLHKLPGAYDPLPHHAPADGEPVDSAQTKRDLYAFGPDWSYDGRYAVLEVRARDNKDRWLALLDPETGGLTVLDRQRDDAWIAGPGISWWGGASFGAWMGREGAAAHHYAFQSERSGFSHLYRLDVATGAVTPLTSGTFEVFDPRLSEDGRTWYFSSSEGSPHERHVYRMPAGGGARAKLTSGAGGYLGAEVAPGGGYLAALYSTANRPPEVVVQRLSEATAHTVTASPTEAWAARGWMVPEIVGIPASDGARVPARIYRPVQSNGAAVLFVHGAGYLQNVHTWWSSYFREYMFHNLLVERGYTVLDLDFRASAGYGRDWRTDIYRHMGGRDLQDYVDASKYVGEEMGIDPERVFIYGGSYGGFITLMALFTEAEHFGGGAALRAVTDWAHYNHTYTANILNTPATDSLAYARSSPIHFAEGLEDPLLIAHGLIDTNVQPQDVIRLAQRLIELGKTDWELAVYPVEGHGFTEPSSWTDEYRRILELIEESVGPQRE